MASPVTNSVISLSSLLQRLHAIDCTDPAQLSALYDSLLLLSAASPPRPNFLPLAAARLAAEDVFLYFKFANPEVVCDGQIQFKIPEFSRVGDYSSQQQGGREGVVQAGDGAASSRAKEWMDDVAKVETVWGRRSRLGRRATVDLVLTDVLWGARETYALGDGEGDQAKPGRLPLRVFTDLIFSHTVPGSKGGGVVISGRCDIAFGHAKTEAPFLGILELRESEELEQGFLQLLAYLGTLHHARKAKKIEISAVSGIFTDGLQYCFVAVDNGSMVYRSTIYDLIKHTDEIYNFILEILHEGMNSEAYFSPQL